MQSTHIVGVDPGLVHTGCVMFTFDPGQKIVLVDSVAVPGPDVTRVQQWLGATKPRVFIEGYRPRSAYDTDAEMTKAVQDFKAGLPNATVLLNTGVKKVVKRPLMELLQCWQFNTVTHHQDLRSAARIALLGMLRTESTNRLLADIVLDHINGHDWKVVAS